MGHVCTLPAWHLLLIHVGNNSSCFTRASVCVLVFALASRSVCCSHCTFVLWLAVVVFHVVTVVSVPKISLIIACIIGVIAYRLAVYAAFASIMKDSPTAHLQVVGPLITPQLATSVTASCINFVIIMILNLMYERVAVWITDMGEGQSKRASTRLFNFCVFRLWKCVPLFGLCF